MPLDGFQGRSNGKKEPFCGRGEMLPSGKRQKNSTNRATYAVEMRGNSGNGRHSDPLKVYTDDINLHPVFYFITFTN